MHGLLMLFLTLTADQEALPDSQTVLTEIRALRLDLRNTAATAQRVQIVIYRLQAQAAIVERAEGRLTMARAQCKGAEDLQKYAATQIEQLKKQSPQNEAEQKTIELSISALQSTIDAGASQWQQCQSEQADAEVQLRVEQAKRGELENQLEQLDQVLTRQGRK